MKKIIKATTFVLMIVVFAQHSVGEIANLGASHDTYIRDGRSHTETGVSEFLDSRDSQDFVPYIQFDMSALNISSINAATLTLNRVAGSRNDGINNDRFATYGLPDIAGNTLQAWDELLDFDPTDATNGLDFRNVGVEYGAGVFDSGIDRSALISLDPEDGTGGLTETIIGDQITLSGASLVSFLQTRADANGLVTFLIPLENGGSDRGYGIASKENSNAALRPLLTLDFTSVPEPGSFLLLMIGGVGLAARRRRTLG